MAALNNEERVLRGKIHQALEDARHALQGQKGPEMDAARKKLPHLIHRLEGDPKICDLPVSAFFLQKELDPKSKTFDARLAQVLRDERIHMLSKAAARPLAELKALIESADHEFPVALEWTHAALNKTEEAKRQNRRNTWMGSLASPPLPLSCGAQ